MLKGLIFDLDGVLIDSIGVIAQVFDEYSRKLGIKIPADDMNATKGMSLRDKLAYWRERHHFKQDIDPVKASWELFQIELTLLGKRLEPDPVIISFLKKAKSKGIKIGVTTMSTRKRAGIILERRGIMPFVDAFVTSEEVTRHRPDPEAYQLTAKLLSCPSESCIAFDDSLLGIQAAKTAGMRTVGVYTEFNHDRGIEGTADMMMRDFSEISIQKLESLFNL